MIQKCTPCNWRRKTSKTKVRYVHTSNEIIYVQLLKDKRVGSILEARVSHSEAARTFAGIKRGAFGQSVRGDKRPYE